VPPAQQWTAAAAPGFDAYITECSSGEWQKEWPDTFRSMIGTVVIDGLRNGARGILLWNLALDEQHGPHTGGCATCRGVVTITADGHLTRNAEYYALAHLSRFAREGARVIGSTSDPLSIRSAALLDADGRTVTILLQNMNSTAATVSVVITGRVMQLVLQAGDMVTLHGVP
jgi:glucosylceramidase